MWILIPYIFASIITARFLERKRFNVAIVLHSVMFVVLSFFVLMLQNDGLLNKFIHQIFELDSTYSFKETLSIGMHNGHTISSFILLIEVFVAICSLFGAAILAKRVVEVVISKRKHNLFKAKREKNVCICNQNKNHDIKDLCKIYCRMIC